MKKFLHYILKEDGRSGTVVNGVVTYTGTKTPLPQSPDGWQDLQIAWERNLKDHGIIRNFSLPFGFVRDGAKIIRDAIYNNSIEEKIFLLIQRLSLVIVPGVSYNWLYNYLYRGELDLSAAEDSQDMINVPCMEGGLHKLLKANRGTKYTFTFDDKSDMVKMDGIDIFSKLYYLINTVNNYGSDSLIDISYLSTEGINFSVAGFTVPKQAVPGNLGTSDQYFLATVKAVIIRVYGSITIYFEGIYIGIEPSFAVEIRTSLGQTFILANATATTANKTFDFNIDFPVALGEKLFLVLNTSNTGTPDNHWKIIESNLYVDITNRFDTTYIKCYRKSILYKKLIGAMGIDESLASSQLCLDNDFIIVTSGDAIRGLPDAKITTSLDDFFKDMDSTFMAGLAVANGKIEIESRIKYYDTSNPIDLGNIKDFTITSADDFIYNKFKFGHVKPDIEDINGKYEPNGSNELTGPITKIVKDYEMISRYKAGPYEIESLRFNLDGKISTDDNRDSGVYVINCNPAIKIQQTLLSFISSGNYIVFQATPVVAIGTKFIITGTVNNDATYEVINVVYESSTQTVYTDITITTAEIAVTATIEFISGQVFTLNRPTYTTLEGVPTDTIFNLPKLTPKAMLLAHDKWIRSMNYGLETGLIKFNSGDKNTDLLTVLSGVTIDENADESIGNFGEIMFMPFYFNLTTEVPSDLADTMEITPNKCFKFTDPDGNIFEGFLISAGIAPNDSKEQEFKLLATKNNNLSLLI